MVFEHRDPRHSKVHVLARSPLCLGRDRDLDSVLWHECNCSFIPNKPRHAEWVGPVQVEQAHEVREEPDAEG